MKDSTSPETKVINKLTEDGGVVQEEVEVPEAEQWTPRQALAFHSGVHRMGLHSKLIISDEGHYVLRVPGGWVYYLTSPKGTPSCTYVPKSEEFFVSGEDAVKMNEEELIKKRDAIEKLKQESLDKAKDLEDDDDE